MKQEQRISSRRLTGLWPFNPGKGSPDKPQQGAFTLVEIMIVVSLLVLLAVVALPNFLKARATAWQGACVSNLRHIDDAIQQWAVENAKSENSSVGFTDISPYLRRSVVCPAGGQSFGDSYLLTIVGTTPSCLLAPSSHILPSTAFEVVNLPTVPSTSPGQGGPSTPPLSNGPGGPATRPPPPGHGEANGPGTGHGRGNGHNGT